MLLEEILTNSIILFLQIDEKIQQNLKYTLCILSQNLILELQDQ